METIDEDDLNEYLIANPVATFLATASGHSMVGRGILDGDILIIDRHVEAKHDDVVIAALDGQLTCKILDIHNEQLRPANPDISPISIYEDNELIIEGVVIHSIRTHIAPGRVR
ncbi:MAG TPA: DNA polymerase V [bacterium]|nr:DNA polymerase V [bacterium]